MNTRQECVVTSWQRRLWMAVWAGSLSFVFGELVAERLYMRWLEARALLPHREGNHVR